jgi:hypothetical protein
MVEDVSDEPGTVESCCGIGRCVFVRDAYQCFGVCDEFCRVCVAGLDTSLLNDDGSVYTAVITLDGYTGINRYVRSLFRKASAG